MSDSARGAAATGTGAATPTVAAWSDDGETTAAAGDEGTPDEADSAAQADEERHVDGESLSISVPDDATDEEVAAIAAAIGAHLREEAEDEAQAEEPTGDRWDLSARLLQVGRRPADVPRQVPDDQWVAAGRVR